MLKNDHNLSNAFDGFYDLYPKSTKVEKSNNKWMPVDILEYTDRFEVQVFAAGVPKTAYTVSVSSNELTIETLDDETVANILTEENPDSDFVGYTLKESGWQWRFKRTFTLPCEIDCEAAVKTAATCEDGVLNIVLPKTKQSQPHKIVVK